MRVRVHSHINDQIHLAYVETNIFSDENHKESQLTLNTFLSNDEKARKSFLFNQVLNTTKYPGSLRKHPKPCRTCLQHSETMFVFSQ